MKIPFLGILAVFSYLCLGVHTASALTISPVRVEVTGDPGQTLSGQIEMLNEQNDAKQFFSSYENFEPAGDTGSPKFIGNDDGLATWMQTDVSVQLAPNEKKVIPYTITIPKDAEPGGYFAAIFWGGQNPATQEAGEVAIGGKLGVLILLRVSGDIKESAGLSEYGTQGGKRLFTNTPVTFSYRFTNSGGDRVVPLGDITIKNIFGMTSGTFPANEKEGNVLPNSSRKFVATWGDLDTATSSSFFATAKKQFGNFHFGLYRAHLSVVYGTTNQTAESSFTFCIIPWQLLTLIVIAALLALVGLKQYNSWIISRSAVRG